MGLNTKFSLKEIAGWQLNKCNCKVELPTLQRGFVWKPKQIEDLWDSLLRGFPIGSFLLSKTKDNNYHLMDGQQRATAIFLGFFNPYLDSSNVSVWSIKGELPVVWIDIKPDDKPDKNLYSIRLVTSSHPWGYQQRNNDKILTVKDRHSALELFKMAAENKNKGYTTFEKTTTFPYDAAYPIPLSFFLEAEKIEDVIHKCELYLPPYFNTKSGTFSNKEEFIKLISYELYPELTHFFTLVKRIEQIQINYDILLNDVLFERDNSSENDDPTLFVRINSAGTSLNGDDLIYSIYKAIFPETKELIETIGLNFIKPTQVISFASRIVNSKINKHEYSNKINVREFQQKIKNEEFKNNLHQLIKEGQLERLIKKAIDILLNKDSNIPPVVVKQFINKSHELFLFFMYWLLQNEDSKIQNFKQIIIGKLLTISWFGYDSKKFVREVLWKKVSDPHFWQYPLGKYFGERMYFLIPPEFLIEYYDQKRVKEQFMSKYEHRWGLLQEGIGNDIFNYYKKVSGNNELDFETANKYFWQFIDTLRWNRSLVLFAQKEYLQSQFQDYNQMENLDDTDTPWDWDHIYPSSWVYRKENCEQIIKDWQYSIGNIRAISLELNRSEGDHYSPKERLSNSEYRVFSFVGDNDWLYWEQIENRIYEPDKAILHFNAIVKRMINIYNNYWEYFNINNVI